MDYRIFNISSGEDESSVEAHVLVRAYRAVWRCTYGAEPTGRHQVAGLELVMDFGGPAEAPVGNRYAGPASTVQCVEPTSTAAVVLPEGDMTADLWTRVRLFSKCMPSGELEQMLAKWRTEER